MNGFTPVQFGFMVLFCHSFGNRSERPRALQLLIKMLIRCRLKWEEPSLLYRAFVFKYPQTNPPSMLALQDVESSLQDYLDPF